MTRGPVSPFFCENLYIYVYIDNFSLLTFFEKYITSLIKKNIRKELI